MSNRLNLFNELKTHAWLKKPYARLSNKEIDVAKHFIKLHDSLDKGSFEHAVNRMFLDKPKPKHWTIILELLICSNYP